MLQLFPATGDVFVSLLSLTYFALVYNIKKSPKDGIVMLKPEILSPVGNVHMLEAAVRAGADAVYLGMGDFNARRNAQNFDRGAFADALRYCRVRGVRTYMTLNTLISDGEFERAFSDVVFAYENGKFVQKAKVDFGKTFENIRGLYIGEEFYLVSDNTLCVYNINDFSKVAEIKI